MSSADNADTALDHLFQNNRNWAASMVARDPTFFGKLQDVHQKHERYLGEALPPELRHNRLCELNVMEQVVNLCQTTIVQDAWERGQSLTIHSWVYGLGDGLLRDLGVTVSQPDDLTPLLAKSLSRYRD